MTGPECQEWLSVLPIAGSRAELAETALLALTAAPAVQVAGAAVTFQRGQDASGLTRVRLLVSHADPETVARTRDALLLQGRRLRLRVFLV